MAESNNFSQRPHVLVIDDDERIRDLVSRFLYENGFVAMNASDAQNAQDMMQMFEFDVLVVDVMMPGKTGVQFTSDLRKGGNNIPVLLLTALSEAEDRISGLESGADDYLSKPFEPRELVLRLQSILKRVQKKDAEILFRIGAWEYNPFRDELCRGSEIIRLTTVEANLLRVLSENAGQIMSREDLARACGIDSSERTIDVQVTRLRRKIEENTKVPRYLQTVRGKGYILRVEKA